MPRNPENRMMDKDRQTKVSDAPAKNPNLDPQDKVLKFDGQWLPSWDGTLIGDNNFQSLINFRYAEDGLDSVNGYTGYNAAAVTTYENFNGGVHFKTSRTNESFMMVQAVDDSGNGKVIAAVADPGISEDEGYFLIDFDSESNIIVDNWAKDAKEFSDWTNTRTTATTNSLAAPDLQRTGVKITEDATAANTHLITVSGAMAASTDYAYSLYLQGGTKNEVVVYITDTGGSDGVTNQIDLSDGEIDNTSYSGNATVVVAPSLDTIGDWYHLHGVFNTGGTWNTPGIIEVRMTEADDGSYSETYDGDGTSYFYMWGFKITANSTYQNIPSYLHSDNSANLTGRFSNAPAGSVAYCNGEENAVWSGREANVADVFTLVTDALPSYGKITDSDANDWSLPVEVTDKVSNTVVGDFAQINHEYGVGGNRVLMVLSTRPLKRIKLYVDPSNYNTNAANTNALVVDYWDGSAYAKVSNLDDTTEKLQHTGELIFDDTISVAKPKHYQERYLYNYLVRIEATSGTSSANIYQVTVESAMQEPSNVWDGLYRSPIQCQFYDDSDDAYNDYTLHVQEASTVSTPVGLYLGAMQTADYIYVMFNEKCSGIRFVMLGNLVNSANSQIEATTPDGVQYWDGVEWEETSFTDETLDDTGDSSFAQTGLVYWEPPSDEEKITLFGSTGYCYRFSVDGAFAAGDEDTIVVDLVQGVPAQVDLKDFDFPSQYKNKLFLCAYTQGNEGNRIDYSLNNAPDVFNGVDTSDDGYQSLYVGGVEKVVAATQLYNRFGSNIFATMIILKEAEVWLLTGDGPEDFELYPISFSLGCVAPSTVATAEVGFELGEDVERNVAMWISHSGPVMFDGAVLNPIDGLETFFDPNSGEKVNWDALDTARGWFDTTYDEWNVLLPMDTNTSPSKWLCYDLRRKKWFEKDTNSGFTIRSGFQATDSSGRHYTYGGSDNGVLYELESGTSWDGQPILRTIITGDFFPTQNPWDITLLRRLKFVCERIPESDADIEVFYQPDTESDTGIAVTWQDVTTSFSYGNTAGVSFVDLTASLTNSGSAGVSWAQAPTTVLDLTVDLGVRRVVRSTLALNKTAWSHAFKFTFSSANYRLKPIMWGYQYIKMRTDT